MLNSRVEFGRNSWSNEDRYSTIEGVNTWDFGSHKDTRKLWRDFHSTTSTKGSGNPSFYPYGLPPDYTPPIGFDLEKKATSYMVATHDTKGNEPWTSTFISTQGIVQPDVVHVSMEKQPKVKPSPHVTTPLNVEDFTNKFEMLEERLRAIEGVQKFEFRNAESCA